LKRRWRPSGKTKKSPLRGVLGVALVCLAAGFAIGSFTSSLLTRHTAYRSVAFSSASDGAGANQLLRGNGREADPPPFENIKVCKALRAYSRYSGTDSKDRHSVKGTFRLRIAPKGDLLGLKHWHEGSKDGTGSELAQRRYDSQKYHRIFMTTVPRSGNTWLRQILEQVTAVATGSEYVEGGQYIAKYGAHFPARGEKEIKSACGGTSFAHAGSFLVKHTHQNCVTQVHYPSGNEPVVVKGHSPWGSFNVPETISNNTFHLIVIRNPIDNWRACLGYYQLRPENAAEDFTKCFRLRKYIDHWLAHVHYWVHQKDIPVYVIRYEDMLIDPAEAVTRLLRVLPGTYPKVRSKRDVEKIVALLGPTKGRMSDSQAEEAKSLTPFQVRCGKGFAKMNNLIDELGYVTKAYAAALLPFGYLLDFVPDDDGK